MKMTLFLLLLISMFFCACEKNTCDNSVKAKFYDATGTDGCTMIIELADGELVEPRNLSDFDIEPKHGEKIWLSYHLATSGGTVCMIGDIVFIDCITKR